MEDEWHNGLERRLQSVSDPDFWYRFTEADKNYAADKTYGLAHFPTDPETRADILLKLLRHAMSDLQNDLSLAGQVIFRMSRWKLFQNIDNLQRALCIIGSELKDCDGTCFENLEWDEELPDHSCIDVRITSCADLFSLYCTPLVLTRRSRFFPVSGRPSRK